MPHFIGRKYIIMGNFKIGDCVGVKDDFIEGEIVNIEEDVAYVEFRTAGGGGCLPFKLSELELKHEQWCITTDGICNDGINYLGWQYPVWDENGYFWTSKEVLEKMIANNTPEHPFLFNSRRMAIKHLKSIKIPQKCRVIRW